jgi:hypothetical protein
MHRAPIRSALRVERLEGRATPATHLFATGVASGAPPRVNVYALDTPTAFHQVASFLAYPAGFAGGVTVAHADLNGDGVDDIVTGAGPGGGPVVKVWDGASLLKGQAVMLKRFFAYDPKFTGGVYVAASAQAYLDPATLNAVPGIITGAGAGGGPHVRIFDFQTLKVLRQFFAFQPTFTGGVRVAAFVSSDIIVTGAGPGGGPIVREFLSDGTLHSQFYAFSPTFAGGVFVAAGSFGPPGGLTEDVAVSAGPGGPQYVGLFNTGSMTGVQVQTVTPYPGFGGGVTVAATSDNPGFHPFLLTAPGPLGGPDVRVYDGFTFQPTLRFNAYDPAFLGGVFVG